MKKQYLLFDLDGTLTDPALGITNSVMHALAYFGIQVENRETLFSFIGPPLFDSFVQFYHFTPEQADLAIEKYREYFSVKGLFENTPYPHIHKTLETLRQKGYHLAVATSKPEPFAIEILKHFELDHYFDVICGSEMNSRNESKADVIKKVIRYFDDLQLDHYLMIGDRHHDVNGAKACGIECLGVLYGYGSKEELESAGAIHVVATLAELVAFIDAL